MKYLKTLQIKNNQNGGGRGGGNTSLVDLWVGGGVSGHSVTYFEVVTRKCVCLY